MRYAVIMAGGSGTRLWPLSRKGEPKQLLKLFSGKSLLQLAFERARALLPADRILVCTGAAYSHVVKEQLPELSDENLLGEPEGRDSLNAVAWPAAVLTRRDPEAVIATLTADQLISPIDAFVSALEDGYRAAEELGALVTFGVVPTNPHTGYGYLQRGKELDGFELASEVTEFKEKPDEQTAIEYLESGQYWWNAGMFVWQGKVLLEQLEKLQPATFEQVSELAQHPEKLSEIYPKLFKTSVDYAIMEPVSNGLGTTSVVAVGLPIEWLDVGSYESLYEALEAQGPNRGFGAQASVDSQGNLLINTTDGVIGVAGLKNTAVVRTDEITLVAPLAASQQIKAIVEEVSATCGKKFA